MKRCLHNLILLAIIPFLLGGWSLKTLDDKVIDEFKVNDDIKDKTEVVIIFKGNLPHSMKEIISHISGSGETTNCIASTPDQSDAELWECTIRPEQQILKEFKAIRGGSTDSDSDSDYDSDDDDNDDTNEPDCFVMDFGEGKTLKTCFQSLAPEQIKNLCTLVTSFANESIKVSMDYFLPIVKVVGRDGLDFVFAEGYLSMELDNSSCQYEISEKINNLNELLPGLRGSTYKTGHITCDELLPIKKTVDELSNIVKRKDHVKGHKAADNSCHEELKQLEQLIPTNTRIKYITCKEVMSLSGKVENIREILNRLEARDAHPPTTDLDQKSKKERRGKFPLSDLKKFELKKEVKEHHYQLTMTIPNLDDKSKLMGTVVDLVLDEDQALYLTTFAALYKSMNSPQKGSPNTPFLTDFGATVEYLGPITSDITKEPETTHKKRLMKKKVRFSY
jgi:hypothetical protein